LFSGRSPCIRSEIERRSAGQLGLCFVTEGDICYGLCRARAGKGFGAYPGLTGAAILPNKNFFQEATVRDQGQMAAAWQRWNTAHRQQETT
jgi:hypothetical protein